MSNSVKEIQSLSIETNLTIPLATVECYGQKILIPTRYVNQYQYVNCYPHVIPGDYVYGGLTEQRCQYLILQYYLSENGTFVDVGAGCGAYSLLASHVGAQIYSFEPNTVLWYLLQRNLGDAACCYPIGITHQPDQPLYIDIGNLAEIKMTGTQPAFSAEVRLSRLDTIPGLSSCDVDVLKIDVEGMAYAVLQSTINIIDQIDTIFVELHDVGEEKDSLAFLRKHHFDTQYISEKHIIGTKLLLPKDFDK